MQTHGNSDLQVKKQSTVGEGNSHLWNPIKRQDLWGPLNENVPWMNEECR
jgi:hypothetical protein